MARDGTGNYSRVQGPYQDGQVIDDDQINAELDDIATALTNSWTRDGTALPTANIPMGNRKFTGLAAGTTAGDSVRYEQVAALARPGIATFEDYGAVGNGSTNDSTACQAALDSGNTLIMGKPGAIYQLTTGLTFPAGITVDLNYSTLRCASGVAACVTFGTSGGSGTIQFRNGTVTRSGGSPGTSTVGVDVVDGYRHLITNIWSDNHGVCWNFRSSVGATTAGISCRVTDCDAGRASDAFIVAHTWPELYWQGGRIGSNGETDYACSAYVRIKGGEGGPGSGPNSVKFSNVQFNSGGGASWQPANCIEFVDRDVGADGVQELFEWVQCHFEGYTNAAIASDSTWPWITGLRITSTSFNSSGPDFFDLHVNTAIRLSSFVGCELRGASFTYGPTTVDRPTQMFDILACHILGAMTIATSAAGSAMTIIGGNYSGLTLVGDWNSFELNSQLAAGSVDLTAALGNISISSPQQTQSSFTPDIAFGGASTGITYGATRVGRWHIEGNVVWVTMAITLTSKGSATGTTTVGLPFACVASGGGVVEWMATVNSLSGTPTVVIQPGDQIAYLMYPTTTGMTGLTEAHFNNTTQLRLSCWYFIR